MDVSIFTGRELEFLAGLRTSWSSLYRQEFARLLKEHDEPFDNVRQEHRSGRSPSGAGGEILPFAPEYRKCTRA